MNYNLDKSVKGIIKAVITFDSAEWNTLVEKSYNENKSKYTVQGFRKGKAPRSVIEGQYGEHTFTQPALDAAFDEAYHNVLSENADISPIDSPKVALDKFDPATELVVSVEIPVLPDFSVASYKGREFTMPTIEVTDEQLQQRIDRELLRGSKLVEIDTAAQTDDVVNIDFEGFVDGVAFEGGKADNYQLKLGSHSFIDTFEDQLVGMTVGESKEVNVTFPAEYHQADLSGKPAVFKCTIKMIRRREMPAFDDEWVKNVSEFDNIEEYKKDIQSIIYNEQKMRVQHEMDNTIIDTIVADTEMEVPDSVVDAEQDRMLNGLSQQLSMQGLKLDDYLTYMGKNIDEFKAEQREYAIKNSRSKFVLEKIITDENIKVTDEEVDARIEEIAKTQNTTAKEIKKQLNQQYFANIVNELLMSKVFDYLKSVNTIKE